MEEDLERIQRNLNDILADLQRATRERFNRIMGEAIDAEALLRFARQMGGFPGMSGQQVPDPYRVLGLERSASDEEVKKRYRELVRKLHPDVAGKGTDFLTAMVNSAYEQIRRQREPECED